MPDRSEKYCEKSWMKRRPGDSTGDSLESVVFGALQLARIAADASGTIVLVEGISDQAAIDTLAKRLGRDLEKEGVTTVPIGGATKIWPFLEVLGPRGSNVKLAGLYDIGEERHFRRALERAGFGAQLTRADMESLGFYVCAADLEDELIRSLGAEMVLAVVVAQGDLWKFRIFQRQPEWCDRDPAAQLRRWLGTTARRKQSYAKLLVNALDMNRVPEPLERLLAYVEQTHSA
jgi:hypothetical protein